MIRSVRRWLPVLGVASVLASTLALTGQGVASADVPSTRTTVLLVPAGQAPALPARAAVVPPRSAPVRTQDLTCHAGQDWENRFEICRTIALSAVVTVIDSKTGATTVIGVSNFLATHHIVMNPNSRTLGDNLTLTFTTGSGDIAGLSVVIIGADCGANCPGSVSWLPQPATPGSVDSGTVAFSSLGIDTVALRGTYNVVFPKPNAASPPGSWSGPSWRCDSAISIVGGCVNPSYIPTMTSMATLPNISASIRAIQNNGPSHWGRPGSGRPLNRTSDAALADRNYTAACGGRTSPSPSLSCDEYPFKTTYQGASRTAFPDWGFAFVPITEQSSQGGLISSFYQGQRLLDGDAFWVAV